MCNTDESPSNLSMIGCQERTKKKTKQQTRKDWKNTVAFLYFKLIGRISSGKRQWLRFFSFLDNQVKHFTPCVVKSQNLSCGVTWDGCLHSFYILLVLSTSIKESLWSQCPTQLLLATNALSLLLVTFSLFFLFLSLVSLLFWQTCWSLPEFSLFSGIISHLLPPGLCLSCSCSLLLQRLLCLQASPVGLGFLFC